MKKASASKRLDTITPAFFRKYALQQGWWADDKITLILQYQLLAMLEAVRLTALEKGLDAEELQDSMLRYYKLDIDSLSPFASSTVQ